jgi:hypothetical protein
MAYKVKKELTAFELFLKLNNWGYKEFYDMKFKEKTPTTEKEIRSFERADELYEKVIKRFHGKTGIKIRLKHHIDHVSFQLVDEYYWVAELRVEKNLHKYTEKMILTV